MHAERLVYKLDTFTDLHRAAQEHMRALIWWFFADLKAYRFDPGARRTGCAVLDRPDIPLHTNGSERDIRCQVIKRKLGGGTHSDVGRDCGDACLGLMRTCAKLGIGLWGHLGDRLGAAGRPGPNSPILSATAASQPAVSRPGFCPAHRNVG